MEVLVDLPSHVKFRSIWLSECAKKLTMDFYFSPASQEHVAREKAKARELRRSLWWRQQLGGRRCYHCEQMFPVDELTMDHLIPIVRGGKTTKTNVVVSCKPCNSAKGYLTRAELALRGEN